MTLTPYLPLREELPCREPKRFRDVAVERNALDVPFIQASHQVEEIAGGVFGLRASPDITE